MPPDPSPDEVADAIDDVFAEPAFQNGLDSTHMSVDDLAELLEHYVGQLFKSVMLWLKALADSSPILYYLLIVALLLILALLLWHMAFTLTRAFRGSTSGEVSEDQAADADARARRFRDLRAEAQRLAGEGERREAMRYLLLALLALLAEEQVLNVARSWTPREVLAQVESVAGQQMASFRGTVEDALYGNEPVSAEAYAACETVFAQVVRQVRSR